MRTSKHESGAVTAARNAGRRRSLRIDGSQLPQHLPRNICEQLIEKVNICMGAQPKFREYSDLKKEADIAFDKADDDHNGFLDADELVSLAGGSEERVQRLIRVFDIDGNGSLTRNEFEDFYVYLKRTSALGSAEAIKSAEASQNYELIMLYKALPKLEDAMDNYVQRFEQAEHDLQRAKAKERAMQEALEKIAKASSASHIKDREREYYEEFRRARGGHNNHRLSKMSPDHHVLGRPRAAATNPW